MLNKKVIKKFAAVTVACVVTLGFAPKTEAIASSAPHTNVWFTGTESTLKVKNNLNCSAHSNVDAYTNTYNPYYFTAAKNAEEQNKIKSNVIQAHYSFGGEAKASASFSITAKQKAYISNKSQKLAFLYKNEKDFILTLKVKDTYGNSQNITLNRHVGDKEWDHVVLDKLNVNTKTLTFTVSPDQRDGKSSAKGEGSIYLANFCTTNNVNFGKVNVQAKATNGGSVANNSQTGFVNVGYKVQVRPSYTPFSGNFLGWTMDAPYSYKNPYFTTSQTLNVFASANTTYYANFAKK